MQIPSVAEVAAQICQGREDSVSLVLHTVYVRMQRKFNDDIAKIIMKFDDDITNNDEIIG